MGKKNKKRFIDKKTATTFHLIRAHPGSGSGTAFNLLPKAGTTGGYLPEDFPTDLIVGHSPVVDDGSDLPPPPPFGLFPEQSDGGLAHDYDYSQHLMRMGEGEGILLGAPGGHGPDLSTRQREAKGKEEDDEEDGDEKVREEFEKELRDHADELKEDYIFQGDFLEALEGDVEYGELADDFVFSAMAGEIPKQQQQEQRAPDQFRGVRFEEFEEYEDEQQQTDEDDDRQQRQIDVDFELLMKQYEDEDIGELDEADPEVQGKVEDISAFNKVLDRQLEQQQELKDPETITVEEKSLTLAQVVRLGHEREKTEKEFEDDIESIFSVKPKEQWDCESIISTYSNVENHPHMVREPRRDASKVIALSRDGLPIGVMSDRRRSHLRKKELQRQHTKLEELEEEEYEEADEEDEEEEERINLGQKRPKNETKAEKALRKKLAKQARKAARSKKKIVRGIYKQEERKATQMRTKQNASNPTALRL